jgi:hypothetical protein
MCADVSGGCLDILVVSRVSKTRACDSGPIGSTIPKALRYTSDLYHQLHVLACTSNYII